MGGGKRSGLSSSGMEAAGQCVGCAESRAERPHASDPAMAGTGGGGRPQPAADLAPALRGRIGGLAGGSTFRLRCGAQRRGPAYGFAGAAPQPPDRRRRPHRHGPPPGRRSAWKGSGCTADISGLSWAWPGRVSPARLGNGAGIRRRAAAAAGRLTYSAPGGARRRHARGGSVPAARRGAGAPDHPPDAEPAAPASRPDIRPRRGRGRRMDGRRRFPGAGSCAERPAFRQGGCIWQGEQRRAKQTFTAGAARPRGGDPPPACAAKQHR